MKVKICVVQNRREGWEEGLRTIKQLGYAVTSITNAYRNPPDRTVLKGADLVILATSSRLTLGWSLGSIPEEYRGKTIVLHSHPITAEHAQLIVGEGFLDHAIKVSSPAAVGELITNALGQLEERAA